LLGDHLHRHVDDDVGVGGDRHGVLADGLQRAVGQANLRLGDFEAVLGQRFGDVGVGDRTEQATVKRQKRLRRNSSDCWLRFGRLSLENLDLGGGM
jgi:hypothetical protein